MFIREMHQLGPKIKTKAINNRNRMMNFLNVFHNLPQSTQKVLKRTTVGTILLAYFLFLIYGGPVMIVGTILLLQIKSFDEVMSIAFRNYDPKDNVKFRNISYHFLACNLLFFWGENIKEYFNPYAEGSAFIQSLISYHRFTCFCLYFTGVIFFVLNLKKKFYRRQFSLLAWTHIVILAVVGQSCLIVKTIFQGMIWFIICITAITSNDIMAYVCGKLFGRTPLIAVSPKKTWEGFIGAVFFTVFISCSVTHSLAENPYFVCPIEYTNINGSVYKMTQCDPDDIFKLTTYRFGAFEFGMYPIVKHAFYLALFGSLVAPFGGFFASGFKRAFNIKDFGDVFPGHGGIMDRFDCQLVMITFVNVYISCFIGHGSVEKSETFKVFNKVMNMTDSEQLKLFFMLKNSLNAKGISL